MELDGNKNLILGNPQLQRSNIIFEENTKNNILYCDKDVTLKNSTIRFKGNNSVVFLSKNNYSYFLNKVTLYNDSILYFGSNNRFNKAGGVRIILSERTHLIIGADGLLAENVNFKTADAHLIYDAVTGERINHSRSIYLGDHVWIGAEALILKGTMIGSGSIIGARSVVSGKRIHSNSVWGGNPVKLIRNNVQFTKNLVHNYTLQMSNEREKTNIDKFIYKNEPNKTLHFSSLDNELNKISSREDKLDFLRALSNYEDVKNRFFIKY